MATSIADIFASYQRYVADRDRERDVGQAHEFSAKLWGEPLTLEEFKSRWKRICRDPALERLWKRRLAAGRGQTVREMAKVVNRLARAASPEEGKAA